jgi:hypothetical protein
MGRGHKINIMATPFRKMNHHSSGMRRLDILALVFMTDVIILAKITEEITGTHKDSP